jgi:hypothetical protein
MADNSLYYGDNLDILRRYVKDESVDLIYLDPPFNSNQTYNVLFADEELLSGARIQMPQITGSNVTFKQAVRATTTAAAAQMNLLDTLRATAPAAAVAVADEGSGEDSEEFDEDEDEDAETEAEAE